MTIFLLSHVDGEREGRVDAFEKNLHVPIDLVLTDMAITVADVIEKVSDENIVEAFVGVVKFGVIDGFNGLGDLVDGDAAHVLEFLPMAEGHLVFGLEALTFGGDCPRGNVGVIGGRMARRSVGNAVASQKGGGILQFAEMTFVVAPGAVDRNKVGS